MSRKRIPTFVDLFAGCGGLSLGLEQAGFTPIFVNELNHDAMSSYLRNRQHLPFDLSSQQRHVHDIHALSQRPSELNAMAEGLRREHGDISLVVGGPPCQGFSGIGHRRTFTEVTKAIIPSNHLYSEMARVIEAIQPRAFIFENVRGLLSSRWNSSGEKGEIWQDVQRTFSEIGGRRGLHSYSIDSALVFAKNYQVPQNRPRVILIGIRDDVNWTPTTDIAGGRLPNPSGFGPDLIDLLGDLSDPNFAKIKSSLVYPFPALNEVQRLLRTNNSGIVARKGSQLSEMDYSNHSPDVVRKFQYMIKHQGKIPAAMQTKKFAQRVLPERWPSKGPTITATSLPDDYVHFELPRILTVREWARLQMFPDHYEFSGKRTTGGRRRAGDPDASDWSRDLPKYTQIGNAVPVELARQIGQHLLGIIG